MVMSNNEVCIAAHAAAEKVIAGFAAAGMQMTDVISCARTACGCDGIDADSAAGELYQDRFVGHVVNVQRGTAGL